MSRRLARSFYARPTRDVARALLGKILVHDAPGGRRAVRIVETEAYLGAGDPASHASRGPTPRNRPMFGRPGKAYVYFVYGMYDCMNVVTERDGIAGAVLIRGAEPIEGLGADARVLAGPGKLARALGVTTSLSGADLVRGGALHLHDAPDVPAGRVRRGPRVGLRAGATAGAPWRYWVAGSPGVSPAGRAR